MCLYDDPLIVFFYLQTLERRVATDPTDVDAWIWLALSHFDPADEGDHPKGGGGALGRRVRLLEVVHADLAAATSGSSSSLSIGKAALQESLRVLSRSLEIESNAYSEALWLLFLKLSALNARVRDGKDKATDDDEDIATLRVSNCT